MRKQKRRDNVQQTIPASEFKFNKKKKACICPAEKSMFLLKEEHVDEGKKKLLFKGRFTDCRECSLKKQCMRILGQADVQPPTG
ncbi:transposase [Microbulbifer sp. TRSA001]|uniref:transposase n=1 Tax=Microbulbifer sp. TRSA001 TaxID=3243381 RepID=UPI0040390D1E